MSLIPSGEQPVRSLPASFSLMFSQYEGTRRQVPGTASVQFELLGSKHQPFKPNATIQT